MDYVVLNKVGSVFSFIALTIKAVWNKEVLHDTSRIPNYIRGYICEEMDINCSGVARSYQYYRLW
ncbi:hypothetical protein D3C76_1786910 [compost metagenome]